jgi:hypothetical protein
VDEDLKKLQEELDLLPPAGVHASLNKAERVFRLIER